jgi:hypothetical protein
MAIPPQRTKSSRLPAPSLFVGPPSRNASNTSLLPPPVTRQRSYRAESTDPSTSQGSRPAESLLAPDSHPSRSQPDQNATTTAQIGTSAAAAERIDALWAQMQNTLEEVELSASGPGAGTSRFGAGHAQALAELRDAQIALAQAWGRGAEEDADAEAVARTTSRQGTELALGKGESGKKVDPSLPAGAPLSGPGAAAGVGTEKRGRSGTVSSSKSERTALEEETEKDLGLARARREANDRYFQRVNASVKDVVAKLEDVARAMKGVELESKEIWGETDSLETGSVT